MAGESAQREFERRRERRRQFRRSRKGRMLGLAIVALYFAIGAMVPVLPSLMIEHVDTHVGLPSLVIGSIMAAGGVLRLFAAPQSETAWRRGAEGEQIVGHALDELAASGARSLHDLRMPGSRANIDHITVTPRGVFTVDAKRYAGKLETRRRGRELWIAGRNRSKLLGQAQRQAAAVEALLRNAGHELSVHPALCFVGTKLPWLFAPTSVGDVLITTPRKLRQHLMGQEPRALSPAQVTAVADVLRSSLQPATSRAKTRPVPPPAATGTTRSKATTPPPPRSLADTAMTPLGTDLTVKPWKRYGKSRLYVNQQDGTTLGFVDLQTNEVVPTDEQHRRLVGEAVADYLRHL